MMKGWDAEGDISRLLAKLEDNCRKVHVGSDTDYRRLIPNDKADQVTSY
jgi:hypothetical protein